MSVYILQRKDALLFDNMAIKLIKEYYIIFKYLKPETFKL